MTVDSFNVVLGARRGPAAGPGSHPDAGRAHRLIAAGELAAGARLVSRRHISDPGVLDSLCCALALDGLEARWGQRARALLDLTGAVPARATQLIYGDNGGPAHTHIWPGGEPYRSPHEADSSERTLCGLQVNGESATMRPVPRGAWLTGREWTGAHTERVLQRCPDCEPHAADIPQCSEPAAYPVFDRPEFAPVTAALAATLAHAVAHNPRAATIGQARRLAGDLDELVLAGCAQTGARGNRRTWERALAVRRGRLSAPYGLNQHDVDRKLGEGFDPSAVLTFSNWEFALVTAPLGQLRGTASPKQTGEFRRRLWNATLDRALGSDRPCDGTVFGRSR